MLGHQLAARRKAGAQPRCSRRKAHIGIPGRRNDRRRPGHAVPRRAFLPVPHP